MFLLIVNISFYFLLGWIIACFGIKWAYDTEQPGWQLKKKQQINTVDINVWSLYRL